MAKSQLDDLINRALKGDIEDITDAQIQEASPSGHSARETQENRRQLKLGLARIASAVDAGQWGRADDLVDGLKFDLDPAAQKEVATEAVSKMDRLKPLPSKQARQAAAQHHTEVKAQLDAMLDRVAKGDVITEAEIKALPVAENVTDAQLDAFKDQLRGAFGDVRRRRGDLDQRDGRHEREADAAYSADKHVRELLAQGVVTVPSRDQDGTDDPRELAALIGRH